MQDPLSEIRAAIGNFDIERARQLVRQELHKSPSAEVYLLAAEVAISDEQRMQYLQKAVEMDPFNTHADQQLRALERKLGPPPPVQRQQGSFGAPSAGYGVGMPPSPQMFGMGVNIAGQNVVLADPGTRFFAVLIDGLVLFILGLIVGVFWGLISPPPILSNYRSLADYYAAVDAWQLGNSIVGLIVSSLYYIYFLTQRNGQTPGKSVMKIRIVKENGMPLTVWDALLRNVIGYFISGFFLLIGYFWILIDRKRQGWHDKLAGTVVIKVL